MLNQSKKSSSNVKQKSNKISNRHHQYQYVSPLQKLDQISKRYMPGTVKKNDELKQLYEIGVCQKFEPSAFKYFFINHTTSVDILDSLIDYSSFIQQYTIDTEDQARYRQPSDPALIQIEFIHEEDPPIIVLIETLHLPTQNSSKMEKIQRLCQIILSPNNVVNCWGDPKEELKKFIKYNLFDDDDIDKIKPKNIQNKFKKWFNQNHPDSPHRKIGVNDKYSLQLAIHLTFNLWLNKRMTLANWGCGIDLTLTTYMPTNGYDDDKEKIINDEEEYRELMTIYAIYDCMVVTKLKETITQVKPSTSQDIIHHEGLLENEQPVNYVQNEEIIELYPVDYTDLEVEIQPSNESSEENGQIQTQLLHYAQHGVHVSDEPVVLEDVNAWENHSLADIMKLHLPGTSKFSSQRETYPIVHVPDELREAMENYERQRQTNVEYYNEPLTRNQKNNRKKRANRYRFEVVRNIYKRFTITTIKQILTDMNIYWVNINVVNYKLFIGLKNQQLQQQVEELLHKYMFTKEHYARIYRRRYRR